MSRKSTKLESDNKQTDRRTEGHIEPRAAYNTQHYILSKSEENGN